MLYRRSRKWDCEGMFNFMSNENYSINTLIIQEVILNVSAVSLQIQILQKVNFIVLFFPKQVFLLIIWKYHAMHTDHTCFPFLPGSPTHPCIPSPQKKTTTTLKIPSSICVAQISSCCSKAFCMCLSL